MHATGGYSISDLAELFSVSRPTVYRTLNRRLSPLAYDPAPYRNRPDLICVSVLEAGMKHDAPRWDQLVPLIVLTRQLSVVFAAASLACWALGWTLQVLGRPPGDDRDSGG